MALTTLRDIVTSEPVLVSPDQNEQFILEVDASQYATGAILYQADKHMKDRKGKPILRPCGTTPKPSQPRNNNTHLRSGVPGSYPWSQTLGLPLEMRKHPVLVITDHANLTYYRHPHKIGQRVAGYIGEYEQYDIQLAYRPGASNRADALSRRPDYAPDPYNDEPVVALPEHLFVPPNTPTIEYRHAPSGPERYV